MPPITSSTPFANVDLSGVTPASSVEFDFSGVTPATESIKLTARESPLSSDIDLSSYPSLSQYPDIDYGFAPQTPDLAPYTVGSLYQAPASSYDFSSTLSLLSQNYQVESLIGSATVYDPFNNGYSGGSSMPPVMSFGEINNDTETFKRMFGPALTNTYATAGNELPDINTSGEQTAYKNIVKRGLESLDLHDLSGFNFDDPNGRKVLEANIAQTYAFSDETANSSIGQTLVRLGADAFKEYAQEQGDRISAAPKIADDRVQAAWSAIETQSPDQLKRLNAGQREALPQSLDRIYQAADTAEQELRALVPSREVRTIRTELSDILAPIEKGQLASVPGTLRQINALQARIADLAASQAESKDFNVAQLKNATNQAREATESFTGLAKPEWVDSSTKNRFALAEEAFQTKLDTYNELPSNAPATVRAQALDDVTTAAGDMNQAALLATRPQQTTFQIRDPVTGESDWRWDSVLLAFGAVGGLAVNLYSIERQAKMQEDMLKLREEEREDQQAHDMAMLQARLSAEQAMAESKEPGQPAAAQSAQSLGPVTVN